MMWDHNVSEPARVTKIINLTIYPESENRRPRNSEKDLLQRGPMKYSIPRPPDL